jgi:regulator of protease activity HflC (stomatin/prohibitin superfamily)
MSFVGTGYLTILLLIVVVVSASVRIMQEYQRPAVFTLGRFSSVKGPGLFFVI